MNDNHELTVADYLEAIGAVIIVVAFFALAVFA